MEEYEEKILLLEKENLLLKEQIKIFNGTLHGLCEAMNGILIQLEQNIDKTNVLMLAHERLNLIVNNMPYELNDPRKRGKDDFYPEFRSDEETLRMITEEKKSLARFGDGEFAIAFHIRRHKFQRLDERLAERIWQVMNSEHPDLLIAIADNYGCLDKYCEQAAIAIRDYMTDETRKQHRQIIPTNRIYSNTYITRPYVIYRDAFTENPARRFEALKKIWAGKKIMIVEGAQTRLGVGNDLFRKCSEIKRIIAPATSSFDRYDDILKECLRSANQVELFILAIGPSSGILAYDLTVEGIQAVDVGHIDIEYEWFLAGKGTRVPVPGKYNNEVVGGDVVEPVNDPEYETSIIASFV